MKILCLSFLRLGDIYMQGHIVRQLKQSYPESEIDLVCFTEFKEAYHALSEVNQWYYLSRTALQNSLIQNEQSIWNSFRILKNMITLLKGNQYDLIFDLSHTQFSYLFFCLLKPAYEYKKWHQDAYLENDFKSNNSEKKHWIEAFKDSLSLKDKMKVEQNKYDSIHSLYFSRDNTVGSKTDSEGKKILLQLNTSDAKKNWNLVEAKKLIGDLNDHFGEENIDVLSSPTEREMYQAFVNKNQIKTWDLLQVQNHLKDYFLLVSLDTSISHLAALKGSLQILLISLGSSHSVKTSPYQENTYILESTVGCFPCNHGSQCNQLIHRCSSAIEAVDVLQAIKYILNKRSQDISYLIENKNIRFIKQSIRKVNEVSL